MSTVRNEENRRKLVERISSLTGNEQPSWGKMTLDQMVSHLVQAGSFPFKAELPDKSTFAARTFIKPLLLHVLPMPKDVKIPAGFDQQASGRKPEDLEADKQALIASIEKLGTLPVDHTCENHPMLGKMSAKQWAMLAHKHIDHHLKQFGV